MATRKVSTPSAKRQIGRLLHEEAVAEFAFTRGIAVVRLTGLINADSLPWIRSTVMEAGRLQGARAYVFDALRARIDLDKPSLRAHAATQKVIPRLGDIPPVAWIVTQSSQELFHFYAFEAATTHGLPRIVFTPERMQSGQGRWHDPVEWASRHLEIRELARSGVQFEVRPVLRTPPRAS